MIRHGVSTKLSREYVCGPGDSVHAGVDELLVQYDAWRDRPRWILQDGSGHVVAVVKQTAEAGLPESGTPARGDACKR